MNYPVLGLIVMSTMLFVYVAVQRYPQQEQPKQAIDFGVTNAVSEPDVLGAEEKAISDGPEAGLGWSATVDNSKKKLETVNARKRNHVSDTELYSRIAQADQWLTGQGFEPSDKVTAKNEADPLTARYQALQARAAALATQE